MKLTSRLFGKPAWQNRDPDLRAQAVSESRDAGLIEKLPELAQHDESPAVRLAALGRINTEAFWLDARLRESDQSIIQAADEFLARAVMRKANPDMLKERLEWFVCIDQQELVRSAARQAPDEALRAAALDRIQAPGFLGDCYMSERSEELAARILERIDQASTLQRIIDKLRKTNKKRARAAEQHLATITTTSGHEGVATQLARRLVEQAEALSRGDTSVDRKQALARLESDWKELQSVPEALERRFTGAIRIVRNALNRPATTQSPGAPIDTPAEQKVHEDMPVDSELLRIAERLRQQEARSDRPSDNRLLSQWDRAWNAIEQPGAAEQALREEMLPLLRGIQKRCENASKPLPRKAASTPTVDAEALDRRLDEVGQMLEQGEMVAAHTALLEMRRSLDKLPGRQRPGNIMGRHQRMEGRLKEMRNWQHWSNNQVRDELIAQVEHLAGSDQHPDAITTALKEARTEWQRLESLELFPEEKRRFAAPPGQWRRFQAACKQAFEQARPFFEKRSEVKEHNLEVLDAFIDKGMQLADGESPDSGELLGFMRKARQAIRRLDDLPPKARGLSAGRLKTLMNRLSERLDEAYKQVELTKRRLVTEARELVHEKDLAAAIDRAKALQSRWQKAGSGRRRIEQQLWKEFREPIDPLFKQLDHQRQEKKQEHQEAVAELEALCHQAEELAGRADAELAEAEGRFRGLSDDWHSQPQRPQGLNKRFTAAEDKFSQRLSKLRDQAREQSEQALEMLADAIQSAWRQRIESNETTVPLSGDLPSVDDDPVARELSRQLARVADATADLDELCQWVQQNAEAARQVAVEMEFLAGVDTPAADRDRRMDYQVKRLARQLGERNSQPDLASEFSGLQQRWYATFPQPPELHKELAARIDKCRNVLRSMMG
jgi:DNA repair protein SbcC/Rad50